MTDIKTFSMTRRTAVITGGSKNIGLSIAHALHDNDMNVAIVSSNLENLEAAKSEFKNSKYLEIFPCNLRQIQSFEPLLQRIHQHFHSIDVLVHSAGILDMSSIEETTEAAWDDVMAINLKAAFFLTQKALVYLKNAHHPRVIHISSNSGRMGGFANGMSYSASKGGMISLTYGLARQLAQYGITVNCVAPGTIESDMSRARDPDTLKQLLQRFPVGRLGTANEVASAVRYFADTQSDFTTGAVLDVNGGLFMG